MYCIHAMALGSVQILHKSLEEAKKSLDDTNQAIQKMSGRDSRFVITKQLLVKRYLCVL